MGLASSPIAAARARLGVVVGYPGAAAAQDVRGPHDDRVADPFPDLERLFEVVGEARVGHGQADLGHGRPEQAPVLRGGDGGGVGADHLHAVTLENPGLVQLHGQVEPGLAAEGRQEGVWAFAGDDRLQDLGDERLDVGAVGDFRVGHDRRRVGVDQHDPVTLRRQAPGTPGCPNSRTRTPAR